MNKILRADRTLYLLNEQGNENTFFALVQNGRGKSTDDALELAKDIERRVNSHDAMVSALQQARKWIREQMADNGCPEDRLDNPPAGSHLANIEAALAAAGAPQ